MNADPLFPYQQQGAAILASRQRWGLLDDMGLGKTCQAIRAADICGAKRGVVIAPAMVREVWAGEMRKFGRIPRRAIKAKNIHDLGIWLKGRADVLLLSYEMAVKFAPKMRGELIEFLAIDEGHYLKSSEAARTRTILGKECDGFGGLVEWALRAWWLTGTPMPNDPVDIWTFLRFSGAMDLTLPQFTKRYFTSRYGTYSARQEPRPEMTPELRQIIAAVSTRRTEHDVDIQLPPIFLTTTMVDGDSQLIIDLLRDYPGLESSILHALDKGGLSFLDAQHIATLRRLIGEAKAPAYAQLIIEELKNGLDRIVIGGIHTDALATVSRELRKAGLPGAIVVGATSEAARVEAVRAMQAGELRWIVGNLKTLGTGQTLTAAAAIDLFEQSWSPADNAQFLRRVRRIGQVRRVRGRCISLSGTIDEMVGERVIEKTRNIMALGGGLSDLAPLLEGSG